MTRDLPPLSFRAAFRPDTVDVEQRTVEVVWTTGASVLRGFWERYYEELSLDPAHVRMGRLNNGAPFLDTHDSSSLSSVLGVVESARLEKGQGVAVVRFAKAEDDPNADAVFRKVKDGILQNISVGYRTYKYEKISGGEEEIPTYRAIDWEPYELSAVPAGADDGAGFRAAASKGTPNQCVIVVPHKENRSMDPAQTPAAPPAAPPPPEADVAARAAEAAVRAERQRASDIRALIARHQVAEPLAARLLADGVTVEQARALVLEDLATRSDAQPPSPNGSHGRVEGGEDASEKFVRGASAWLYERAGLSDMLRSAAEKDPARFKGISLDGAEFRGLSLIELARESLERRGQSTRGMNRMDLVGAAFTHRSGSYQTTSDFAVLFENVMFKTLLGAYALAPDTWSKFCRAETVADFRPSNRFRTGSLTTLDSLNEHGEFKNKAIPDGQKTSISVGTKGNIIALSRQAIINDDMGALLDMPAKLGRAAKLSIESDVYALLTANSGLGPTQADSQPFFHSNRANVNATGSALGTAGIDADRVVMAQQKDISSNEYLDLRPALLLVPVGLGAQARVLNSSIYDQDGSKFQKPNAVVGLFREVIDSPRLTGTRRYLLADPSIAPAIVVAFLEGQGQAPVLESEAGWRVDGTEWKVRLDYKAQMFDPKGAVTNAGA